MDFDSLFQKYDIPLLYNGVKLPKFQIPESELIKRNLKSDVSDYTFLTTLCIEGLESKVGKAHPNYAVYRERLKVELQTFKELGFCGYVLITWDIIHFCRRSNIATGYARGSCAGSLVLYLIDVVNNVDPIENKLYFERFLSKTRAKFKEIDGEKYYDGSLLMDVDLDISFKERNLVMEYIEQKYPGQTAKLLTVSTLSSKVLLKEVFKIYEGKSEEEADAISEMIPKVYGRVFSIDESLNGISDDAGNIKHPPSKEFIELVKEYPEAISIARKLHGLYFHYGVHASAIIISASPINDMMPLQLNKDKEIITGYSMEDALSLAIKEDLLGLRSVTLVQDTCKLVGINLSDINVHEQFIYDNLCNLDSPHGLFQIEAETNYNVLRKIKPRNLDDLSAIVAIARPGALQFMDAYAEYVDTGKFQSINPIFDDVLKDTGGLCIYQEQMMRAANKIGFTLEESEILRRIVGKKKLEEVKAWQQKIKDKVKENQLDPKISDILWKILDDSASYSFNRSHAVSYATMCAATAYLKFKYPKEFFVTLLKLSQDEQKPMEQVAKIQKELPRFGIKLLPPHILYSDYTYKIDGENIRMGLNSIKAISEKALIKLEKFKNRHSSKFDIFRAANMAELNLSVVSNLIWAGSLDDMLTNSRAETQMEYVLWNLLTEKEKMWASKLEKQFSYNLLAIVKTLNLEIRDEKSKPVIKDSRRATLRKHFGPYMELFEYNKQNPEIFAYIAERELLGFSYSSNLYDIYSKHTDDLTPLSEVLMAVPESKVKFVAEVVETRQGNSKAKDTPYIRFNVKDGADDVKIMLFNNPPDYKVDKHKAQNSRAADEKDIVIVTGKKKDGNCVFAETIGIQNNEIFLSIRKLPKKVAKSGDDENIA